MELKNQKISYIFIGHLSTGKKIVEIIYDKKAKTILDCSNLFEGVSKISEKSYEQRNKVGNGETAYYFIIKKHSEGPMFYLLEVPTNYNERGPFELIEQIHNDRIVSINDNESEMKDRIMKIVEEKYQSNYFANIQSDLSDIKLDMNEAIRKQVNNLEDLNGLQEKSKNIKEGANAYKKDARDLERVTCWQNFKWWIIIICAILLLVLIIVLAVVLSKKEENPPIKSFI